MLTQNRMLNTISNNLANTATNGFKADKVRAKTFGSMVIDRIDSERTPIGKVNLMTTADKAVTDFSQGTLQQTDRPLDFAIGGDGFFAVQSDDGVVYTRNGSFNLDDGGYLTLNGVGRVLGKDGRPIALGTDNVQSDGQGNLFVNNNPAGSIGVYRFPDNQALKKIGEGMFSGAGAVVEQAPQVSWKCVEGSNADMAQQMTSAISAERGLQSCSQALKMYDQVLDKATDIGKI
jgi:flagellar basal-body rod protein FlgG